MQSHFRVQPKNCVDVVLRCVVVGVVTIKAEFVLYPFDPATKPPHPPAVKVFIETENESNKKDGFTITFGLIQVFYTQLHNLFKTTSNLEKQKVQCIIN